MRFSEQFRKNESAQTIETFEALESFHAINRDISYSLRVDPSDIMLNGGDKFKYIGKLLWFTYAVYASKYAETTEGIREAEDLIGRDFGQMIKWKCREICPKRCSGQIGAPSE
jgi:hypothetical protein